MEEMLQDEGLATIDEFAADIAADRNRNNPTAKAVTPEPTATQEATTTQEATPEPEKVVPEKVVEETLPKIEYAPPPQPELSLDDIVSKVKDKDALLKALGMDEYAVGAVNYYLQNGDMTPYLEVKSVDYSKFSEQALVERKLREQYAAHGLSEEDMQLLIEDEVATRYKQNPEMYSEKEMQLGMIRMKADARTYKNEFTERQAKFAPPPQLKQIETAPEPSYEEMVAENERRVLADAVVQNFSKQPVIKIGKDELAFNYESKNPKALLGAITDPQQTTYYTSKRDEQGRIITDASGNPVPDYEFMLELAAHMTDRQNYNALLTKHGKSLGTKAIAEEINPQLPLGSGYTPEANAPDEHALIAQALRGL